MKSIRRKILSITLPVIFVGLVAVHTLSVLYNSIIASALTSVIILVIAALIITGYVNKMVKPIKEIELAIAKVAQGDLDVEINYHSEDEIGHMADSVRQMVITIKAIVEETARALEEMSRGNFELVPQTEYFGVYTRMEQAITTILFSLSDTLKTIRTSSQQVNIGAGQVASGSQILAQGSVEQASSIQQLTAAIELISKKLDTSAHNINDINGKSMRVGEEIELSNSKMDEMMAAMKEISDKSAEISKIIKTIDEIAFQTNILALNAAVEAARAGEAGKGFAVVADEVRNLAGKSAEAAQDTTELIEDTVRAVASGTIIAKETAESMGEVVKETRQVVTSMTEIAKASEEQAAAVKQITLGLDQISSVVQSNSATAEQSAATSEELSGQAGILQSELDRFILKS